MARKIKKKLSRKDLLKEPDELLTFSAEAKEWFTENWPAALIAVGVFALFFIVGLLVKSSIAGSRQQLQTQISEAMNTYNNAMQAEVMPPNPKEGPPPDPMKIYEDASYRMEKILRDHPRTKQKSVLMYYLAGSYMKMGKYGNAQEYYQKVANADAQGTLADLARFNIGMSLYFQKKYEDALKIFREIVDGGIPTARAGALVYGGRCFEEMNKIDDAIKYYRLALDAYSDAPMTRGLDSRIERLRMQSGKKEQTSGAVLQPETMTPAAMSKEAPGP